MATVYFIMNYSEGVIATESLPYDQSLLPEEKGHSDNFNNPEVRSSAPR
jgi:hypothetical protein